jgi:hypothetical protein
MCVVGASATATPHAHPLRKRDADGQRELALRRTGVVA